MIKISLTQESIVRELEKVSNDYNSIIYHAINEAGTGGVSIGDSESIDYELTRLEQRNEVIGKELLPTIRASKKRLLKLWVLFERIESQYQLEV